MHFPKEHLAPALQSESKEHPHFPKEHLPASLQSESKLHSAARSVLHLPKEHLLPALQSESKEHPHFPKEHLPASLQSESKLHPHLPEEHLPPPLQSESNLHSAAVANLSSPGWLHEKTIAKAATKKPRIETLRMRLGRDVPEFIHHASRTCCHGAKALLVSRRLIPAGPNPSAATLLWIKVTYGQTVAGAFRRRALHSLGVGRNPSCERPR